MPNQTVGPMMPAPKVRNRAPRVAPIGAANGDVEPEDDKSSSGRHNKKKDKIVDETVDLALLPAPNRDESAQRRLPPRQPVPPERADETEQSATSASQIGSTRITRGGQARMKGDEATYFDALGVKRYASSGRRCPQPLELPARDWVICDASGIGGDVFRRFINSVSVKLPDSEDRVPVDQAGERIDARRPYLFCS
jgi:hypothetical protein